MAGIAYKQPQGKLRIRRVALSSEILIQFLCLLGTLWICGNSGV